MSTTAADWSGPDDQANPQNWPLSVKTYHSVAIGLLSLAVTAGTSLITPSIRDIAKYFGVSEVAAILTLSLYVVGLGLGPIIAAPISETFGRSVVYKVSAPISMLFTLGAGFSKTFGSLLVCRLLAGIMSGPVLAVGAASNADMFPVQQRSLAVTCFVVMGFSGPALGPIIGGFASQYEGWRWTQWCTIFINLGAYVFILPMRETYKKAILARRAKKKGLPGPPRPPLKTAAYQLLTATLVRPVRMLCTEPIVLFLSLYNSFTFSVLFAFFAAYPYTFNKVYGFNTWQSGLAFIGILVGVQLGGVTSILTDRLLYGRKYRQAVRQGDGKIAPEHRLYNAMMGSFGVTIGLFWFAWTARSSVHWISPVLAGIPFAWGNTTIFNSSTQYLTDFYGPANGASAMAANGIARYGMSAAFPLFTLQMYKTLSIPWATSLLAFLSLMMIPIPWVIFRYGPSIRARSAYDSGKT